MPKRASEARLACSQMRGMVAPFPRKYAATASNKGPLPATTTRLPAIGSPALTRACRPPAPMTFGKVQPGNGRKRSFCSRGQYQF